MKVPSVDPKTGTDVVRDTKNESDDFAFNGSVMAQRPEDVTIELSENAMVVLKKRYLRKDEHGVIIETPTEMFRRVAQNIALAERKFVGEELARDWEKLFFKSMASLEFLPNSPTLMNAGRDIQQLSACFVLPIDDSIDSIFNTIRDTALIHKSGGGTGFSFSRIRPKEDRVKTTNGVASGPVSFMTVFDAATEAIKQGGTRRGANMAILQVDHPDIMEFITCKDQTDRLKNFNISVAITDSFMEAVRNDSDYPLINPRTKQIQGYLEARNVFNIIVHQAWKNGEPGIVYIDRINAENPTPQAGMIESTNPCGEQPLLPYESCNLGSINLARMLKESNDHTSIDYERLGRVVDLAVRFLDDVIEMNAFPLSQIQQKTLSNRKIGLGIMGFADMLIRLGIPYNSEKALEVGAEVMQFIEERACDYSRVLAGERGAFPNFKGSRWDTGGLLPMRNATVTTIAPTGTLSIIAGSSSGVEPLYSIVFKRRILDGEELVEVHPLFMKHAQDMGYYSRELIQKIADKGTLQEIDGIPIEARRRFVCAHDVSPDWHVRMQAVFQKYTHNAVSKTINFPKSAEEEDVRHAYEMAYRLGCKGITVYRDGSREQQVLSTGATEPAAAKTGQPVKQQPVTTRPRPMCVQGKTVEIETGCGSLYVTINEDESGQPFEVFAQIGKAGGCVGSQTQSTARLCSLALRSGMDPKAIIKQLIGISCHKPQGFGPNKILSCSDAIAKAFQWYLRTKSEPANSEIAIQRERGACPDCGGVVEHINGCETCRSCGYSECG